MTHQLATAIVLDLQVALDIEYLARLRDTKRYKTSLDIEYMVLEEEIAIKSREIKLLERQSNNLKLFNQILYRHGVRQWMFNRCFIAHNNRVHDKCKKEAFIYVPAWAAAKEAGLSYGCGNTNQCQLKRHVSDYMGLHHHRRCLQIENKEGDFSSYADEKEAPFELDQNVKYWGQR
jgi:hypothetical protein